MPAQVLHVQRVQGGLQGFVALRVMLQLPGQGHCLVQERAQRAGQGGDLAHAPVMGQVHPLRRALGQAVDGTGQGLGLELHGCGGGQDPGTLRRVELAVAQAEGVAREPAPRRLVPDAVVVPRVPGRVDEGQGPAREFHRHAFRAGHHTLGRHRHQMAVGPVHLLLAVHRQGALVQRGRVHHVACAARVHQGTGPRQFAHQQPHAAGMVQMHVGGDDPVHRIARQAHRVQRGQQARHAEVGAGVDERGAAVLHHEVGCIELVAVEAGVDGVQALIQGLDEGGQTHPWIVPAATRTAAQSAPHML